jgi:hypothetical protein
MLSAALPSLPISPGRDALSIERVPTLPVPLLSDQFHERTRHFFDVLAVLLSSEQWFSSPEEFSARSVD